MKENRSLLLLILLSIFTLGIYALFFWYAYARDMNIVCAGDGRKTRGIIAQVVFSILTLGIYNLIWIYGAGDRIFWLCWNVSLTPRWISTSITQTKDAPLATLETDTAGRRSRAISDTLNCPLQETGIALSSLRLSLNAPQNLLCSKKLYSHSTQRA